MAGTSWLFAREAWDGALDHLVVDEAGQLSLADALAGGTAARNLILLGDPLQLPQVSQAIHPPGTSASVLEHLLGEQATVPGDRGIFLTVTRRLHPAVCGFVSREIYEGRLRAASRLLAAHDRGGGRHPLPAGGPFRPQLTLPGGGRGRGGRGGAAAHAREPGPARSWSSRPTTPR